MKAFINSWHSPDVNFETYAPTSDDWGFLLQLMVGPEEGKGFESFDILVCSAKWFVREVEKTGLLNARHYLVASDYKKVRPYIQNYVNNYCHGETWGEVAEKLSRLGQWEFEDYQP